MERTDTKVTIIVCPVCKGEGKEYHFNGDGHDKEDCSFCDGKRVVKQIVKTRYEVCKD